MTRTEHLLVILSEECAEVSQRVTKALRFGLTEIQPGQSASNGYRIIEEYADLLAVAGMLMEENALPRFENLGPLIQSKRQKIEQFLVYSANSCGTLEIGPRIPPPDAEEKTK